MKKYQACAYIATKAKMMPIIEKAKGQYGSLPWAHLDTDIWTARNQDSYITLNMQFILPEPEPGEPPRRYRMHLGCRKFQVQHNHETIAEAIKELLGEWGISAASFNSQRVTQGTEEEHDGEVELMADGDEEGGG